MMSVVPGRLIAFRSRRICTSTVRSSISLSCPQTLSSNCPREKTRPGCSMKCRSRRNSVGPMFTFCPFRTTLCATERSEEHTSELQSLMRIYYAVFCLKNNTKTQTHHEENRRPGWQMKTAGENIQEVQNHRT